MRQTALSPWGEYVERFRRGEWRDRIFHDMVLEDARRRPRPRTVLDVGCGRGFDGNLEFQASLARAADRYVGIEPDAEVEPAPCFTETHRCLFEDAPLAPGSVDVAFAIMVLEHLAEPQRFWDKLHEVLAVGGVFWALTVDGRHWFARAALLAQKLRVKDYYLDRFIGERGVERYENYPVHYRCNTPAAVARFAGAFRSCEFVSFSRVGQCNYYYPRLFHGLADRLDRRAIRLGKPGVLLAVRAVK
jgi:SAM-dependent methyltransferase